jgi:rhodanese-related sulfurtransferase
MILKTLFRPIESKNSQEAEKWLETLDARDVTVLDVRQPSEYNSGHLPGAKLIPLTELEKRVDELDPEKPTLVY